MNLIKKLNHSTKWNAIESVLYKAILATHQACLFYIASKFIYGLSSVLFALMYLMVEFLNLGLDKSLAQLSQAYLGNKQNFWRYLVPQLIFQACLLSIVLFVLINNYTFAGICFSAKFKCAFLTKQQWLLISIIIFSEAIRKTLRLVAQLFFLNRPAAILELGLISIYVSIFWTSIWIGYEIGILTIYIPLLLQSIIGVIGLVYLITPKMFVEEEQNISILTWKQVLLYRIKNYLYQLSEMLFSGNFLISFFTPIVGIVNIGPLKLANYIAVFLKAVLERTFGLTSLAIFAKTKHLAIEQKELFNIAQKRLSIVLVTLTGLFFVFAPIATFINKVTYLSLLFFGFALINNFFIIYEQLFIVRNQISILFLLNTVSVTIFWLFNFAYPEIDVAGLIFLLVALRVISLLVTRKITNSILGN